MTQADFEKAVDNLSDLGWKIVLRKMGNTSFSRKKIEELTKSSTVKEKSTSTLTPKLELPTKIIEANTRRKELYKKTHRLHAFLTTQNEKCLIEGIQLPDQATQDAAIALKQCWDEIEQLWEYTNYFDKHKTLMPEKTTTVVQLQDTNNLYKRRMTLLTYLTPSYLSRKPTNTRDEFKSRIEAEIREIDNLLLNYDGT